MKRSITSLLFVVLTIAGIAIAYEYSRESIDQRDLYDWKGKVVECDKVEASLKLIRHLNPAAVGTSSTPKETNAEATESFATTGQVVDLAVKVGQALWNKEVAKYSFQHKAAMTQDSLYLPAVGDELHYRLAFRGQQGTSVLKTITELKFRLDSVGFAGKWEEGTSTVFQWRLVSSLSDYTFAKQDESFTQVVLKPAITFSTVKRDGTMDARTVNFLDDFNVEVGTPTKGDEGYTSNMFTMAPGEFISSYTLAMAESNPVKADFDAAKQALDTYNSELVQILKGVASSATAAQDVAP